MDRATLQQLHRRLLTNVTTRSTDMAAAEIRVPASEFCDPEVFAREQRVLFAETPQPVAFSGELPEPNCFLALQVMDTPVLLTRDNNGQLRAFINACSHRGAPVASGAGTAGKLVCPFHGWAYATDGTLRGRPSDAAFSTPMADCSLPSLTVSEKYGIIVIATSTAATQHAVDTALEELGQELTVFGFRAYHSIERRSFEVGANWKLVNDLSLESYHFNTLHRDTVAQVLTPNAIVDTIGRHSRWAFPLKSIVELADTKEEQWPDTLQGSCTYTLYPGVMLIVNSLGAQIIRAEPGTCAGQSRVVYVGVCRNSEESELARQAYEFGGDVFVREDLPIAEACQRGIAASGRDLIIGKNEPLLQFWHRTWRSAID